MSFSLFNAPTSRRRVYPIALIYVCLPVLVSLSACIEKDVRLYVEIDDSCAACCDTTPFSVGINGQEETVVTAGNKVLIERIVTTAAILSIAIDDDTEHPEKTRKCRQCVYPEINASVAAKLPENIPYVYIDTIYFEDKDMHAVLTCSSEASLCEGLSCVSPPDNQCTNDGALRISHQSGVCANGKCVYAKRETDCDNGKCEDGECTLSPCEGVVCNDPPESQCDGENKVVSYARFGVCSDGTCVYPKRTDECEAGDCADGRCEPYVCHDVYCDKPPAPYCRDEKTRRVFTQRGLCAEEGGEAVCQYDFEDTVCEYGCSKGVCEASPCEGVTCNLPWAPYCDGDTLVVFGGIGRCTDGACDYTSERIDCEDGCRRGRCNKADDCERVTCDTPPVMYCKDTFTLRSYAPSGTCEDGVCSYDMQETLCIGTCRDGRCLDNACLGVVCNTPPPTVCEQNTLVSWDGNPALCFDGVCKWNTAPHLCSGGCQDGACRNDGCIGVVCNSPPANYCLDNSNVVRFENTGTCSDGTCAYESETFECSGHCALGRCVVGSVQTDDEDDNR